MEILNNLSSIYCFITFILGAMFASVMLCIAAICRYKESRNKVHFYVARDENKALWLFLGKPIRDYNCYITKICGSIISDSYNFKHFGLNPDDYKDLKWEDEPVEVFLNMED